MTKDRVKNYKHYRYNQEVFDKRTHWLDPDLNLGDMYREDYRLATDISASYDAFRNLSRNLCNSLDNLTSDSKKKEIIPILKDMAYFFYYFNLWVGHMEGDGREPLKDRPIEESYTFDDEKYMDDLMARSQHSYEAPFEETEPLPSYDDNDDEPD